MAILQCIIHPLSTFNSPLVLKQDIGYVYIISDFISIGWVVKNKKQAMVTNWKMIDQSWIQTLSFRL